MMFPFKTCQIFLRIWKSISYDTLTLSITPLALFLVNLGKTFIKIGHRIQMDLIDLLQGGT